MFLYTELYSKLSTRHIYSIIGRICNRNTVTFHPSIHIRISLHNNAHHMSKISPGATRVNESKGRTGV